MVTVSGCSGNTITDYSSEYKRIRSPNYPKDYDDNVSVDMICKKDYDVIYCLAINRTFLIRCKLFVTRARNRNGLTMSKYFIPERLKPLQQSIHLT